MYIYAIFFKLALICDTLGFVKADRSFLILTARFISAIFGTLTILIVYCIGKNLYDKKTGLIAAAFLTVMPMAVVDSHYGSVDTSLTFFLALCILFLSNLLKTGQSKYYMFAGVAAGLAISSKYIGAIILISIFVTHILINYRTLPDLNAFGKVKYIVLSKQLISSFILSVLVFFATTTYALPCFTQFLGGLATDHAIIYSGNIKYPFLIKAYNYLYHTLKGGITWNLELVLLLGAIFIIIYIFLYLAFPSRFKNNMKNTYSGLILLSFIIPYFLLICSFDLITRYRYLIPLLPFLAIAGSYFLVETIKLALNASRIFITRQEIAHVFKFMVMVLLCSYLIIAPFQICISMDKALEIPGIEEIAGGGNFVQIDTDMKRGAIDLRPDARVAAFNWIRDNVPKDSVICKSNPIMDPEIELLSNITRLYLSEPYSNLNSLIYQKKVNYIILHRETKINNSFVKNYTLIKQFDAKDYKFAPIRIYWIQEVPLPSSEIGGLALIDPVSKRRFSSWGIIK